MATKVDREIRFQIKMIYAAREQMSLFNADIKEITNNVKEFSKALGSTKSGKALEDSVANLGSFIGNISKLAKNKDFKKFNEIATSFSEIGLGVKDASSSLDVFERVITRVSSAGKLIGENQKEISATARLLKTITKEITGLSEIKRGPMERTVALFDGIARAASQLGEGGVLGKNIELISSKSDELGKSAIAMQSIATALASVDLGKATAIAGIGQAFRGSSIMGVGSGGGGTPPGVVPGGYGSGYEMPKLQPTKFFEMGRETKSGEWVSWAKQQSESIAEAVEQSYHEQAKPNIATPENIQAKLREAFAGTNLHMVERIQRIREEYGGSIAELIEAGFLSDVKAINILSASMLAQLEAQSSEFMTEGSPGSPAAIASVRGTMVHKAVEDTLRKISETDIGQFLISRTFDKPEWAAQVKEIGQSAAADFKRIVEESVPSNIVKGKFEGMDVKHKGKAEMLHKVIVQNISEVENSVRRVLGPDSLFKDMYNDVVMLTKQSGRTLAQEFAEMALDLEQTLKPLIAKYPAGFKGGGVPKHYPKDIQEALHKHMQRIFDAFNKMLEGLPEGGKEFRDAILKYGEVITGQADIVAKYRNGLKRVTYDLKTGWNSTLDFGKKAEQAAYQLLNYNVMQSVSAGVPLESTEGRKIAAITGKVTPMTRGGEILVKDKPDVTVDEKSLAIQKEIQDLNESFKSVNATMLKQKDELIRKDEQIKELTREIAAEKERTYWGTEEAEQRLLIEKENAELIRQIASSQQSGAAQESAQTEKLKQQGQVLEQQLGTRKQIAEASREASAASVPPAGAPPSDGGGGGGERFGYTLRTSLANTQEYIRENSTADQVITALLLKQRMLGEEFNITTIKLQEYNKAINSLSTSFSKYLSFTNESEAQFVRAISAVEKISEETTKYSDYLKQAQKQQDKMNKELEKFEIALKTTFSAQPRQAAIRDFMGGLEGKLSSMEGPDKLSKAFGEFSTTKLKTDIDTKKIQDIATRYDYAAAEASRLRGEHNKFNEELSKAVAGVSGANSELKKYIDTLVEASTVVDEHGNKINKMQKIREGFAGRKVSGEEATQFIAKASVEAREVEAFRLSDFKAVDEIVNKHRNSMKVLKLDYNDFGMEMGKVNLASKMYGDTLQELKSRAEAVQQSMIHYSHKVTDLTTKIQILETAEKSRIGISGEEKNRLVDLNRVREENQKILDNVSKRHANVSEKINELEKERGHLTRRQQADAQKFGDAQRSFFRTQIEGFAMMLKSQMAWVAGYALVFGTIRGFKDALGSVITIQHEWARAMRTAYDGTMLASTILEQFGKEGTAAMIKFGEEAKTVGEVLYKLGSAGLLARESLAALNSTMSMIVGTEANITQATNLVAASYNNFKDDIVGVTTLQEKFKYLNDVITATFQYHQVSLQELTDGYKTLIAMGRNSNMTFLEMSAVLGTLNDHLIRSGEAGRSMQTVLSRISKESSTFAKAFNIQIDPHAPLDILDILKQINDRMKEGALTTEEVSKVFDRLGLRGARTFITLTENYKKLENNIERLRDRSEDAADRMARIMLEKPDVAFKQLKQTLAVLVREGFEPLVKVAHSTSLVLTGIGNTVEWLPSGLQTLLNYLLKITVALTVIAATTAAVGVISSRYFKKTGQDYGALSKAVIALGGHWKGIGVSLNDLVKSTVSFFLEMNIKRLKEIGIAFQLLGLSIGGSITGLITLASIAAIIGGVALYKHLSKTIDETANKYAGLISKQIESTKKSHDEISALSARVKAVVESGKASEEHVKHLKQELDIKKEIALIDWKKSYESQSIEMNKLSSTIENSLNKFKEMKKTHDVIFKDLPKTGGLAPPDMSRLYKDLGLGPGSTELHEKVSTKKIESDRVSIRRSLEPLAVIVSQMSEMRESYLKQLSEFENEDQKEVLQVLIDGLDERIKAYSELISRIRKETEGSAYERKKIPRPIPIFSPFALETEMAESERLRKLSQEYSIRKDILELEKEIGITSFARKKMSEEERNRLREEGVSENEINKILTERLMIEAATLLNKEVITKDDEILINLLRKLVGLQVQFKNAVDATEKTVRGMFQAYYDATISMERSMGDLSDSMGDLGVYKDIYSTTVQQTRAIEDHIWNLKKKEEEFRKDIKEDVVQKFLLEIGVKTPEEYFQKLRGEIEYLKIIQEMTRQLAKEKADYEYQKLLTVSKREHRDAIDDLIDQFQKYFSVEEQVSKRSRELRKDAEQRLQIIDDERFSLMQSEKALSDYAGADEKYIEFLTKETNRKRDRINNLEKEYELYKKLIPVLKERSRVEAELARQKGYADELRAYADVLIDIGKYGDFITTSIASMQELHKYELDAFDERKKALEDFGFSVQEIEEYRTALVRKHEKQRLELFLDTHDKILESMRDLTGLQAEYGMRQAKEIGDWWKATIESAKAGSYEFIISYENISKNISDITTSSLDTISGSISNMMTLWVRETEESGERYKEVMRNMLINVGQALVDYGIKLMFVAMIQKMLTGMMGVSSQMSTYDATNITRGTDAFYGGMSPLSPEFMMQRGGYIRGGVPGKDSVPILGMEGEYMIPRDSVDYYGKDLFDRLRKKEVLKAQDGGFVTDNKLNRTTTISDGKGSGVYKEGDTINYFQIRTNDVNSFKQYLYENKQFITGLVVDEQRQRQ